MGALADSTKVLTRYSDDPLPVLDMLHRAWTGLDQWLSFFILNPLHLSYSSALPTAENYGIHRMCHEVICFVIRILFPFVFHSSLVLDDVVERYIHHLTALWLVSVRTMNFELMTKGQFPLPEYPLRQTLSCLALLNKALVPETRIDLHRDQRITTSIFSAMLAMPPDLTARACRWLLDMIGGEISPAGEPEMLSRSILYLSQYWAWRIPSHFIIQSTSPNSSIAISSRPEAEFTKAVLRIEITSLCAHSLSRLTVFHPRYVKPAKMDIRMLNIMHMLLFISCSFLQAEGSDIWVYQALRQKVLTSIFALVYEFRNEPRDESISSALEPLARCGAPIIKILEEVITRVRAGSHVFHREAKKSLAALRCRRKNDEGLDTFYLHLNDGRDDVKIPDDGTMLFSSLQKCRDFVKTMTRLVQLREKSLTLPEINLCGSLTVRTSDISKIITYSYLNSTLHHHRVISTF